MIDIFRQLMNDLFWRKFIAFQTVCFGHHQNDLSFYPQGFINVRVWFPKLPGVVMMSDQEVIIMCKPPDRVVTQNKAAGFAGAL